MDNLDTRSFHQISMICKDQNNIVHEVLKLSDSSLYQDVILLCSDGSLKMSSFLLAAVFPLFKNVLSDVTQHEEDTVISLPDVFRGEMENLLNDLTKGELKIFPGDTVKFFLQNLNGYLIETREHVENETKLEPDPYKLESFKSPINIKENEADPSVEVEIDFSDLDPLIDDIKEETEFFDRKKNPLKQKKERRCEGRRPKFCTYDECNWSTFSNSRLEVHLRRHENGKRTLFARKCIAENCEFEAPTSTLRQHLETIHSDLSPNCNQCGKGFTSFGDVLSHLRSVHDEYVKKPRYKCEICGYVFPKLSHLNRHMDSVHKKLTIECDRCNKKFRKANFSRHKCFVTPKKDICTICGKSVQDVKLHIEGVHEGKMVQCPICQKSLKEGSLRVHMLSHEEMKQCCPTCGISVQNLELHNKRVHTVDEEKQFQCQDCGKGFIRKHYLETHRINVHLKTYPYQCRYGCDVKYNDISNRNSHEKKKHGQLFQRFK